MVRGVYIPERAQGRVSSHAAVVPADQLGVLRHTFPDFIGSAAASEPGHLFRWIGDVDGAFIRSGTADGTNRARRTEVTSDD